MMLHDVTPRDIPVHMLAVTDHGLRIHGCLRHSPRLVRDPDYAFDAANGPTDSAAGNPAEHPANRTGNLASRCGPILHSSYNPLCVRPDWQGKCSRHAHSGSKRKLHLEIPCCDAIQRRG